MTPTNTPAPMTHEADNEYQRGYQDGRSHGDLLTHGKARMAHDKLTKAGLGVEADAMWAEIARLQAIVCSACEASMEAERDREAERTRADALAAEVEALKDDIRCAVENASIESGFHDRERRRAEAAEARIAELEAGIGRYTQPLPMSMCAGKDDLIACALGDREKLRSLLRITHGEGRGNG